MKWKRIWISLWLSTLLAVFIVTLINHSPYFLLGGSSSVAPVMEEILTKYPNNHKNGDFNYVSSASSGAPPRVASGLFGIGWLSKQYQTSDEQNLFTFQMMRDGLVIVYNVPTNNLINPDKLLDFTAEKVQALYLQKKSWKTVFPDEIINDMPVQTFTRPNGSGTRDVFDKIVLGGNSYYNANTVDSSSAMLNLDSGSIGYSSFADIKQSENIAVSIGTWENVMPSFDSIKNEEYTLWRPFTGLINRNYKYKKNIIEFLKWVFSDDSEIINIFEKYGPRVELDDVINQILKEFLEV